MMTQTQSPISEQCVNEDKPPVIKANMGLLIIIAIGSMTLLIVLMAFSGNPSALALDDNKLLVVQNAKVEVMPINIGSAYTKPRIVYGKIEAVQQSNIGFELSGTLNKLLVLEGALVKQGDVLATLDVARLKARQNELKSSLSSANANAKLANLSANRVQELVSKNLEPQQRLDEVQAQLEATNAAASEVQAKLDSLTVELDKSSLRAPFDGQVVLQFLDIGTVVNAGQAIFSILAKQSLEARFGLPEQTAFGLAVGDSYELTVQGTQFKAIVKSIAQQRNFATRTVDAVFSIDSLTLSPQQQRFIISGDIVSLSVDIVTAKTGAWVPISSLATGVRGLWTLYVVDDKNRIQTRLVSIEYSDGMRAFVSGAIAQHDKLIISGIHRLTPHQHLGQIVEVASTLAFSADPNLTELPQ